MVANSLASFSHSDKEKLLKKYYPDLPDDRGSALHDYLLSKHGNNPRIVVDHLNTIWKDNFTANKKKELSEDENRHLELKSKYNSEIANLVKLESKINQWFNTSHVGRETKTRYEKEDRWEKAYNKAKATPEWDNYCKQERKSKSYDFADVCA